MHKIFDPAELNTVGQFPIVGSDTYAIPGFFTDKLNTPITPRENWELFYNRQGPLWVPDMNNDMNFLYPEVIPDCVACSMTGGKDAFGSTWIPDVSNPSLPAFPEPGNVVLRDIADWRELDWPDPSKWDWDKAAEEHKILDPDRPNAVFFYSALFERMITLMGFENAAMSFYTDPDSTHAFIDRLLDYNLDVIEHLHKYLRCDVISFSDDWSSQQAPFFSPDIAYEFFYDHIRALVKRCHELGMRFIHHSCGNGCAFVPVMIAEGVDQWQYNYEAVKGGIKDTIRAFGDRILFDGYPGYVDPLPEDDVMFQAEVRQFYEEYAGGMNSSFNVVDMKERSFDFRKFSYQVARETACRNVKP